MEFDPYAYGYNTERLAKLFERALKVLVEGVSSPSRSVCNYRPYPPSL